MMRSLYSGVAGLKAHQVRMDIIGHNIANVNTVGFKKGRVTFQEMLSQMLRGASGPTSSRGGINPLQVGLGVEIGTIDTDHSQGSLQSTGITTDLAIDGNGYFVVSDGQDNYYTRAGNFTLDSRGYLVYGPNGYRLQGWQGRAGEIDTNAPIRDLRIPVGETMSAAATTYIEYSGNLNADELNALGTVNTVNPGGGGEDAAFEVYLENATDGTFTITVDVDGAGPETTAPLAYNATAGEIQAALEDLGDINAVTVAGIGTEEDPWEIVINDPGDTAVTMDIDDSELMANQYRTSVSVFDDFGSRHEIMIEFEKLGTNEWTWAANGETLGPDPYGGVLQFNDDGSLNLAASTLTDIVVQPENGAGTFSLTPDFAELTQFAADAGVVARDIDGHQMGTLQSSTIDARGVVQGVFTNGMTRSLGQVCLAEFNNPEGMVKDGDTLFAESANSGIPMIGLPGEGGKGDMRVGTLEMSNVDLAEEFSDMIITQRGYQVNSKIISTVDQMLQEIVNLR